MFSWYKYLIVSLVFSHLGFWSGNLFLIAPFPDLCLLVPFHIDYVDYIDNDIIIEFRLDYMNNDKTLSKLYSLFMYILTQWQVRRHLLYTFRLVLCGQCGNSEKVE